MKLIDIVTTMQANLPSLTELTSTTLVVDSINHVGTTATVTTDDPHGLVVGDSVSIEGAQTPISLALTHDGSIATAVSSVDHDLTMRTEYTQANFVEIRQSSVSYNGIRPLLSVPNRRTFTFPFSAGAPSPFTGNLVNGSNVFRTIRGQYAVQSVVSPTVFTITHDGASDLGLIQKLGINEIEARTNPRITGAISDEAAIASYSRKVRDIDNNESQIWLFVVLDDAVTSRGRDSRIDAHDTQEITYAWQQFLLQPFSVLAAIPAANQTLGRNARDTAEDLLRPILRSVVGAQFPTGLGESLGGRAQFVSHAFARYDGSVYWHEYRFEQRAELTILDTVGPADDVAFRDVDMTLTPNLDADQGDGKMTSAINLDDVPL